MSFIIIYGYKDNLDNLNDNYKNITDKIILIEPRKEKLDILYKLSPQTKARFILIPKILHETNTQIEKILYKDKKMYSLVNTSGKDTCKRETVFTTSLQNIIAQNNIMSISKLILNLDIDNIDKILESLKSFQHIIKNILIPKTSSILLPNFLLRYTPEFTPESITQPQEFNVFTTRYMHTKDTTSTSRIVLLTKPIPDHLQSRWGRLLEQYKFDIVGMPSDLLVYQKDDTKRLIDILYHYFTQYSSQKHDFVFVLNPDVLSQTCIDNSDFDFTDDYRPEILYINEPKMMFKGTRNILYLLYDLLISPEYTAGLDQLKNKKGRLFKIFEKRYMFEEIKKVFSVTNF